MHALTVGADGTLSESNSAVTFSPGDVPADARLQGVAVVAQRSQSHDNERGQRGEVRNGSAATSASLFGEVRIDDNTASELLDMVGRNIPH